MSVHSPHRWTSKPPDASSLGSADASVDTADAVDDVAPGSVDGSGQADGSYGASSDPDTRISLSTRTADRIRPLTSGSSFQRLPR